MIRWSHLRRLFLRGQLVCLLYEFVLFVCVCGGGARVNAWRFTRGEWAELCCKTLKIWFCHVSQWLLMFALPPLQNFSRLLIPCALCWNPVFTSHVYFFCLFIWCLSSLCCLFLHASPLIVYPSVERPRHVSAIISITSLRIKSLLILPSACLVSLSFLWCHALTSTPT